MANDNQVIELEVEEIPLEKRIENSLVKENVTEAVIKSLKEEYGSLRLKSLDDKDSYLEISTARKRVRSVGIAAEKICKFLREDAVKTQKFVLAKEKEILAKIAEVQDPLDAEIKKFEDEVARKEKEEADRKEAAFSNREATLYKLGAMPENGSYVSAHISYEKNLIKEADEELWQGVILPKYQKVFEEKEAVRVAEENKRKEETERLQKEKEAFEEQQRIFREQQEQFNKQQELLRQQQEEADRKERLRIETEQQAERNRIAEENRVKAEKEEKLWRGRLAQLNDIGWNGQFAFAKYDESTPIFTYEQLLTLSDGEFENVKRQYNSEVESFRKEAEQKRLAKIEEEKQAAIELSLQRERERVAEEQRQAQLKKEQEEARRLEELAQGNDAAKWSDFLVQLSSLSHSEMKSPKYKRIQAIAKEKLEEIKALK